ncbi:MAG: DUF2007 domain-containing protein [Bacteroidales bacterium]|nr:DUF2007 domain-containing protein [Bacteroidales bacterium]
MKKQSKQIEVFAGAMWETALVQSMLEDAGIAVYQKDGIMGNMFPWYTAGGGAGSIRLFVEEFDYEQAADIVSQYEINRK